jgi:hypothetical protein
MRKSAFLILVLAACSTNPHQEMSNEFTTLKTAHATLKSDHIRLKNEHETLKSEHTVINENKDPKNMFKFPEHETWAKTHTDQAILHDDIIDELIAMEDAHKTGDISMAQMKLDHETMKAQIDALNAEHESWVETHVTMSDDHKEAIELLKK